MGLLANFVSWVSGNGWGVPPQMPDIASRGVWSAPPRLGSRELLALYHASLEFSTPVELIASRQASVAWGVVGVGDKATTLENAIVDHPLQAIIDNPQPGEMSGFEQRELESAWDSILGEVFLRLAEVGRGQVEVYPLNPTWVTPRYEHGRWVFDCNFPGGGRATLSEEEIVWLKKRSVVDPYGRGIGKGAPASSDIQTAEYAADYNKAFFYNGASPNRIIGLHTKEGAADQNAVDAFQATWDQRAVNPKKAHQTFFTGTALDVIELQTQFKDLAVTELRKFSADAIRQLYHVPPELIGQLAASNRSTIKEALAILAEIVLVPAANARRLQLNTKMLPRLEAMGVDVDGVEFGFQDPTPLDRSGRLEAMQLCPEAFTVNEFREVAGLPALSGGEVYLRQADHWEEVSAGDIIDITPIRRSATPPPLPSPLSHVPSDQPIVRLIINQEVA